MHHLPQNLLQHVKKQGFVRPGQRLGVAVSGGADSVALLRALVEIKDELGIVLKIVHFNHRIRGAESDEDERFVKSLVDRFDLELIAGSADTKAHAATHKLSLEAAARTLRYDFFRDDIARGDVDRIATAHTLDDQAETLLLRLVRGSGLRGLRGVHSATEAGIVRPLLCARRKDIESYLKSVGQDWREDSSNVELHHLRNRIRHELLPKLAADFNPQIAATLARSAEVLAADEDYLSAETERLLPLVLLPGKPVRGGGRSASGLAIALSEEKLRQQPLAMRRRLIRAAAERLGLQLDMEEVEAALNLGLNSKLQLSPQWQIVRGAREFRFEPATQTAKGYEYPLQVPGEVQVPEMNIMVRARVQPLDTAKSRGTLDGQTLSPSAGFTVRNWRAGDRFRQAYASQERKVKELLGEIQPPEEQRGLWPVVVNEGKIVWLRGARNQRLRMPSGEDVVIEIEELP